MARWFLYASAVALLLTGSVVPNPLFVVPLGLALWSKSNPRFAFGTAMVIQGAVSFGLIATLGIGGLTSAIPLIAYN